MKIIRTRRARLAALTAGLAVMAVPAMSASAAAAQGCTFRLVSVRAIDIQEEGGPNPGDEIYLVINGERVPDTESVPFIFDGQTRPASAFGSTADTTEPFIGSLKVRLWEQDPFFDEKIGVTGTVSCTGNQTGQVLVFDEPGSSEYHLTYDVEFVSG